MTAEPHPADPAPSGPPETTLLSSAYAGLGEFAERMHRLDAVIEGLGSADGDSAQLVTRKLRRQIRDFEPTVTMIGQVKAGKTTLVNALIGWPDLLPADINPWTSVVTSLHLDPAARAAARKARFRFFDEQEWDRLLSRGGRVGELASRAGAHKELEKVRAQLEQMREKSRQRLGRKFELLMGQEHEYGFFDQELIQRYVCLGDDIEAPGGSDGRQGHFADITKAADLYLGQADLPHKLCIRDTPGVNDTFMIREQITVNAIRDSRLCVVVLSAHQALSTVDMALIRLISNINSREVIIFVNRIDELADPVRETEEIRRSIVATLKALNGPTDAQIIFGSAWWATRALARDFGGLTAATGAALVQWAEAKIGPEDAGSIEETIWKLSGIPALCDAISQRIATGEGAEFEDRILRAAKNAASGLAAARKIVARREDGAPVRSVERQDIGREIDAIAARGLARLDAKLAEVAGDLETRLDGARQSFLSRATASLIQHLERRGEGEVWTYDPSGLRLLLRSGYRVYATKAAKTAEDIFVEVTAEVRDLYVGAFALDGAEVALAAPAVPKPPPPVILGATIALDVKGNWWTRWWRRMRSYQAFAAEFSEMIDAEIRPFVTALVADHARPYGASVKAALAEFLDAQRGHLTDLADRTAVSAEEVGSRMGASTGTDWAQFDTTVAMLDEFRDHSERRATA